MRLSAPQIGALLRAMEHAFDTLELQRVLLERCDVKLGNISGFGLPFSQQIVQVQMYFQQHNISERLVAAVRDARPGERALVALADSIGYTSLPSQASFEVLVRSEGSPYQDALDFRVRLAKVEGAVCRVETPVGYGTGVLVGKNIVLTNYHVVETAIDSANRLNGALHCLFDHRAATKDYVTPARRVAVVSVCVASAPSAEDYEADQIATNPDLLDYALITLDENVAEQPIVSGGDLRGHVTFDPTLPPPAVSDGLIVLQHPSSKPMKIDIGAVTALAGTRLRHSVNTEKGSSGAPVFNAALQLVALHHAGFEWPRTDHPFNQAVPLSLIHAHAQRQGSSF